jgi:hypothetical protein
MPGWFYSQLMSFVPIKRCPVPAILLGAVPYRRLLSSPDVKHALHEVHAQLVHVNTSDRFGVFRSLSTQYGNAVDSAPRRPWGGEKKGSARGSVSVAACTQAVCH